MFLLWVETGDHSSPVLIKHTLIVGQWQLQGKKETREGDQLPRERWKKTEVEERERGGGEGRDGESSHCDRERGEDMKKMWRLKVSSPTRWAGPPYLGNKKSDSLLRTPDSLVLVHFFNNMWPFFHSSGDWWKLCVIATTAPGLVGGCTTGWKLIPIGASWFLTPFSKLTYWLEYPDIARWCSIFLMVRIPLSLSVYI